MLALGGMREHAAAAAVMDPDARPTDLAEGEVCLYTLEHTAANPHRVVLRQGRIARVECGPVRLQVGPGGATLTGDLAVTGAVTANGVNIGSDHVHGGVRTGGGATQGPQ